MTLHAPVLALASVFCFSPAISQALSGTTTEVPVEQVAISRDQAVASLPPCLVLHQSGIFSKGQCNGVWILTVNLEGKVLAFAAYYNNDLMGEAVTTNFTLGQAIYRHSLAAGMAKPVLKRIADEEEKGLIDVANGIIYDIGSDIGTSMPDAAAQVRVVRYLQRAEALVILLKESQGGDSPFPALTQEQFDAFKAGISKQQPPPPGPKLE